MEPIINGPRNTTMSQHYSQELCAAERMGYANGQHDMVESGYKDMSHYRRRSPLQERPMYEGRVVFSSDGIGIRLGWIDEDDSGLSSSWSFCSGDEYWRPEEVDWWAYEYVPEAEEK